MTLLFLVMIWALPAGAIMIKYDLEKLSLGSEKVVRGEVVDMESRYLVPGQAIYTFVTISVEEVVKGENVGKELILRVPGGTVDDVEMTVSHSPSFLVGEDVLVFVTKQVDGQDIVYNADNGKYTIVDGLVVERDVPIDNFTMVIRAYLDNNRQ
jgi:hypothetical protein